MGQGVSNVPLERASIAPWGYAFALAKLYFLTPTKPRALSLSLSMYFLFWPQLFFIRRSAGLSLFVGIDCPPATLLV